MKRPWPALQNWRTDPESRRQVEAWLMSKVWICVTCWYWLPAKDAKGYGRIWIDGKLEHAHRFLFRFFLGSIPPGLLVCHSCDNPTCVNPDHLWIGTCKDNIRDSCYKGRFARRWRKSDRFSRILVK